MPPVVGQVPEVVQEVGGRGDEPERQKAEHRGGPGGRIGALSAEDQGHEDERVLGPLVQAHRLEQILEAEGRSGEHGDRLADRPGRRLDLAPGPDQDRARGDAPDRKIGRAVACVVEAVREQVGQRLRLDGALQVDAAVRTDDAVHEAEARRDAPREIAVRRRRDQDEAPGARLLLRGPGGERFVDGQVFEIEVGRGGEPLLEIRAAHGRASRPPGSRSAGSAARPWPGFRAGGRWRAASGRDRGPAGGRRPPRAGALPDRRHPGPLFERSTCRTSPEKRRPSRVPKTERPDRPAPSGAETCLRPMRRRKSQDGATACGAEALESVREHHAGLQSLRSMRRIEARRRKASALQLRFSQSLASRRQRFSQAMVRSTIQRFGRTTNPFA